MSNEKKGGRLIYEERIKHASYQMHMEIVAYIVKPLVQF